jgi:putative membrane protein
MTERWRTVMGWGHDPWMSGGWAAVALGMLVFCGLVVALVVWTMRSRLSTRPPASGEEGRATSPDNLLAQRFARGEIDEDEFTRKRAALRGP